MKKVEFEKMNDEKYYRQNPYAWTEQQRFEMNRKKVTYAEVDAREKRIIVKNAFPIKETLKHMMFRFDPAEGGWYHPLGTPEENRQIVATLKSLGVETRMTMAIVLVDLVDEQDNEYPGVVMVVYRDGSLVVQRDIQERHRYLPHDLREVDWPPGVVVCEDGLPRYLPGTGEVI